MISQDNLFGLFSKLYDSHKETEMSLEDYLKCCAREPMAYASTAERMLAAIGEPEIVDTSRDPRMGRIFMNRSIRIYPSFADFYGMEETIERIVGYFRHAAQGLEERKQVLYLLGPVGGGKSSLAERLKLLMEKMPIYVLKAGKDVSPVFESPLGLFDPIRMGDALEKNYKIPKRRLTGLVSPWALKRLDEFGGDISKFTVVRIHPSRLRQICIAKTEPGDENNQDISSLVGKVDIRKLEFFSQNDADAYGYSGGLNRTTQGLLEFVEMFKAPIKMLHPLLTATQESNYIGSENIGAIPYQGVILAHSNEAEWQTFKNNRNNEAFIDRICVIKVPYCARATEERRIYEKLLTNSELAGAPCAPGTLDMLSRFCVLSRLKTHENSNLYSKMRAYDGESLKDSDPRAKTVQEYRDAAGVDEGMEGLSTRFAFKVLSTTFNYDTQEVSADPVHLVYVLE
jgi:serine protein kinase